MIRITSNAILGIIVLQSLHGCTDSSTGGAGSDADGDGYSNEDERRFTSLFFADPTLIDAEYAKAIADPDVPRRYLSLLPEALRGQDGQLPSIGDIPTATVSVAIQGEGSMYPGPGEHPFALYTIHEDFTWDYNSVEFLPIPAPGWRLDQEAWNPPRPKPYTLTMTPNLQDVMVAVFSEGAPEFLVKPTDAIARFVETYFPGTGTLDFDRNEMEVVRAGDEFESVLAPNGLPDLAEAAVLERVLLSPDFAHGKDPEFYYDFWRETWTANLEQARADVAGRVDLPVWAPDLVAVYATMGTSREAVARLLQETLGIKIDWDRYETRLYRVLGPEASVLNTNQWMIDHWKKLASEQSVSEEMIEKFVGLAVTE